MGLEKFINLVGYVPLEKARCYELIKLEINNRDIFTTDEIDFLAQQKYLKMRNPSTGGYHIEGVHPDCQTVQEALAWRNFSEQMPSVLT